MHQALIAAGYLDGGSFLLEYERDGRDTDYGAPQYESLMGYDLTRIKWGNHQLCIDPRYCSSFADLYTPTFLARLDSNTNRSRLQALVQRSRLAISNSTRVSVGTLFDAVYELLLRFYRCEYVYKNTLATKIIVENHSVSDSSLFMEFWANNSKADVVVVNGTTTAYEIKTELDSLNRLSGQICSYKKIFDEVYVVTHPTISKKVCSILDSDIGVIELTGNNELHTIRKAESNLGRLEPASMFDSLRHTEYSAILANEFGFVPDVPNTERYNECKKLFSQISPSSVHRHFVRVLKKRRKNNPLGQRIFTAPYSLRALFLSGQFSQKVSASIQTALNEKLFLR